MDIKSAWLHNYLWYS